MNAKLKFREGWIMLLRPFDFGNLSKPLQKLTILYAYSEKPIIEIQLNDKGKTELELASSLYNKEFVITQASSNWRKRFQESDEDYEERFCRMIDRVYAEQSTVEFYKGEIVQCYVENQLCRFYPHEYSIISQETFDHVLTAEEYSMDIESKTHFLRKDVAETLHYVRSRGIDKTLAERMASAGAKDAVIFRPWQELLEYFCRKNEIYKEKSPGWITNEDLKDL